MDEVLEFLDEYSLNVANWTKHEYLIFTIYLTIYLIITYGIHLYCQQNLDDDRLPVAEQILLVIAHPDDEAMFFTPAIQEFSKHNIMHLLCLSNGSKGGLGLKREQELKFSCKKFGIMLHECVDTSELLDGEEWRLSDVQERIKRFMQMHKGIFITTLLTFDEYGVSGHQNHR